MKLPTWSARQPRAAGMNLVDALDLEFGSEWHEALPQRLLEAVWDGDLRALESDRHRLSRVLARSDSPSQSIGVQIEFLVALYASAGQWVQLTPRQDPHSDSLRFGEVTARMSERALLMARAVQAATDPAEGMSRQWVPAVADLVVRAIRFRDGFSMRELATAVESTRNYLPEPGYPLETFEQYALILAHWGERIVNGVPLGTRNGDECLRLIRHRFGGPHPYADAVRATMVAIRDGDSDTLREIADVTASAGPNEYGPARVLHNLMLAGEKVLHDRQLDRQPVRPAYGSGWRPQPGSVVGPPSLGAMSPTANQPGDFTGVPSEVAANMQLVDLLTRMLESDVAAARQFQAMFERGLRADPENPHFRAMQAVVVIGNEVLGARPAPEMPQTMAPQPVPQDADLRSYEDATLGVETQQPHLAKVINLADRVTGTQTTPDGTAQRPDLARGQRRDAAGGRGL